MRSWQQSAVFALWCLFFNAAFCQNSHSDIQQRFLEGARNLQLGNHEEAAAIFSSLLRETQSPRIKLELARTLFQLGRYRESRKLFDEVLFEPDLPWQVRDNVQSFLRAIDEIQGYIKFSASIISDSNPRNITSQREFSIGGVRLTFRPPEDNKRVVGLRYLVQAYQPSSKPHRSAGYFSGALLDYPGSSLDRLTLDGGVLKAFPSGSAYVRVGLEAGTFGDRRLYEFPYVSLQQQLFASSIHRIEGGIKLGYVRYPHFAYLNADYASANLLGIMAISNTLAASLRGTLERSEAEESPYTYDGATVEPGISYLFESAALLLKSNLVFSERHYAAPDPLFGTRRMDRKAAVELTITSKSWRLLDSNPALVLAIEENRSTIHFFQYRKLNVSIALE